MKEIGITVSMNGGDVAPIAKRAAMMLRTALSIIPNVPGRF
jgi:hypothetical protein